MILDGKKLTGLILKRVKERAISRGREIRESEIRNEIKSALKIDRHTLSNWECNWARLQKDGRPYNPTLEHLYELQWYFKLPDFKELIRDK